MKIAYLMNGLIGGLAGKNYTYADADIRQKVLEYTSETHHFLQDKDVEIDYFIFSWELDLEKQYTKIYNPKKIKCIPQPVFDVPEHYIKYKDSKYWPRIQAHYSRWFGALEVSKMCNEYSLENGIEYDLVVNARLDLCFQNKIDFNKFDPSKFHIAKSIASPNYNWPKNKLEMLDHIFVSSSENMRKFMSLYNNINDYTAPGQCPQWSKISSHFLTVWHLNKLGLLNKETISESNITCYDNGYHPSTDYYIFRYKKLSMEDVIKGIKKRN